MNRLSSSEVKGIRSTLQDDIQEHLSKWHTQALFISPNRYVEDPFSKHKGARKDLRIIKNQARRSLRTFVSGMLNGATPQARPWFNLTTNNEARAGSSTVKRYFSQAQSVLNNHFQISNLYRVLPMAYKDVGVFSNSAFAMLPHPRFGFYFYPFAVGTYAFACDIEGNTNTFQRDFTLSVRQTVERYGQLNANGHIDWSNMDEWVKTKWENADYLDTVNIANVIVPNAKYDPLQSIFDSADRKFQSYTWIEGMGANIPTQSPRGFRTEITKTDGSPFISVKGFDYFPVITPRWEVQADEDYGVDGPGEIAIGDIMTLQELEHYRLEAVAKLVKPPMVGHSSLRRHQASILAGGITYVDDQAAQAGFKPAFTIGPSVNDLIASQAEYTDAIRSAFYEDLFLMLSSERTVSHVTAREIDEKAAEKMSSLAPVLGQWDQDLSSKLIYNGMLILEQQNKMPQRPRELDGQQIRPEYISVLAQAAKASMMNSLERGANFTISLAGQLQDPSLAYLIKGESYARKYLEYVGVDPELINDETEFSAIKQQIAQAQAQAKQQQDMAVQANTAKDLSQAEVGKGSMLDAYQSASSV